MRHLFVLMICIAWPSRLLPFQDRGVIEGRVLHSKSGDPVRKALVVIRRGQESGMGVRSDASGRFQFDHVEPGPYTITAERSGFVIDPQSERITVDVRPTPAKSEVTLKMLRTGAISGRVVDGDGDAVTGAGIQVLPVNRKRNNASVFGAASDDRGEYRAFNIPPGKYRIAVSYQPRIGQPQVKMQAISNAPNGKPDREAYAVTYYPAALEAKLGQTIDLTDGADLHGLDIQLQRASGVTVRGFVIAGGGAPPGAISFVTLSPPGPAPGVRGYDQMIQNSDGAFEMADVLPGTYIATATAPLGEIRYSASRVLQVGNTDVAGIQLVLAPPQTITGIVVPPDGRKLPAGLIAVLIARGARRDGSGGIGQLNADGSFRMKDVPPGDYDVALANSGPGDDLYVNAIQTGDEDALSDGIHVGGQPVASPKIILKANGGAVQVNVVNSDGKPQPDMHVKLLPDAPRRNQMALYGDCKTDASGTCQVVGVTPGSYHVFAFSEEPQIDFRDSDQTRDFEDSGKPVRIAEGERQNVEVKPVPNDN